MRKVTSLTAGVKDVLVNQMVLEQLVSHLEKT